jgi:signal transduction histidine kinase
MDALSQDPLRADVSNYLRAGISKIVDAYAAVLSASDSPLLRDAASSAQTFSHARQIVETAARQIEHDVAGPAKYSLARNIGAARAVSGIHPGESLRASNALFDTVIRFLSAGMTGAKANIQISLAALAMQEILTDVLRVAADAYVGVLLNRIHEAHLDERRRISRELHDRIAHGIGVAQRNLDMYDILREEDPDRAHQRVQRAQTGLAQTADDVRQVITDLRLVEPLESLEKALRLFLESSGAINLISQIEVNGDEQWVPPETVEEVFLIVREALRNTLAHADAHHVHVRIDIAPNELRATVVDDGRGFDPKIGRIGGTGLLSMRERAALLGANLTLVSHVDLGTRVELSVSLSGGVAR